MVTLTSIDPFAYWPGSRSGIAGIGKGRGKPESRGYVFHSNYVPLEPGVNVAEITFDSLVATTGLLSLRIYRNKADSQPAITEHAKTTVLLPSLAAAPRSIRIGFEAEEGAEYAFIGMVIGDCKAHAEGLTLLVGRNVNADDPNQLRSQFGRNRARSAIKLGSSHFPTLDYPVSQDFTLDQTREPAFERWTAHLPATDALTDRWEVAYILRSLEVYGRLEQGARGLGVCAAADPVGALADAEGCVTARVLCAPGETLAAALERGAPGDDGFGYDFLWSRRGVLDGLTSEEVLDAASAALTRLRPGGLAVLMVDATSNIRNGAGLDHHALARISLGLVAAGQIVAQIRHLRESGPPVDDGFTPFGIIVRKSTDLLSA